MVSGRLGESRPSRTGEAVDEFGLSSWRDGGKAVPCGGREDAILGLSECEVMNRKREVELKVKR